MTTFLDALTDLIGITEEHGTEYGGATYTTPSLIDHDDGKENNGEETQRATIRTPRT